MALSFRAWLAAGALAGTTFFAVPAVAAPIAPLTPASTAPAAFDHSRFDPAGDTAAWCRWNCGWGGGWDRRRGWRRNRIDAGDVLIGAAIIGGIAAIASSANRRDSQRDVVIVDRNSDWRQRDTRRFDDRRTSAPRNSGASGLDNAVNQCLDRIERDVRVDTVDGAERTGAGWRVSGTLYNGAPFRCRIGNGGQIDGIDFGDGGASLQGGAERGDVQWSEQRYSDARAAIGGTARPDMAVSEAQMPAYPGGPIAGEVIPETIDGDL